MHMKTILVFRVKVTLPAGSGVGGSSRGHFGAKSDCMVGGTLHVNNNTLKVLLIDWGNVPKIAFSAIC